MWPLLPSPVCHLMVPPVIDRSFCCTSLSLRSLPGSSQQTSVSTSVHRFRCPRRVTQLIPELHTCPRPPSTIQLTSHLLQHPSRSHQRPSFIVCRGCRRTTLRLAIGDAFSAVGTLVSPFLAVSTVSLELLSLDLWFLILALLAFLSFALALTILALALPFGFALPFFLRRETQHCSRLIDLHWNPTSRLWLMCRRSRGSIVPPQRLCVLHCTRTSERACLRMFW